MYQPYAKAISDSSYKIIGDTACTYSIHRNICIAVNYCCCIFNGMACNSTDISACDISTFYSQIIYFTAKSSK